MKKLCVILALLVLFSFLPGLISCTKTPTTPTTTTPTTTTPTTTTPTTTTPTAEQTFKPIKLKYADPRAWKKGYFGSPFEMMPWKEAVEAVSNGRLLIEEYPNQSLLSIASAEVGVSQGVADITQSFRVLPGLMPMYDAFSLPPMYEEKSAFEQVLIYWFFLEKYLKKDAEAMNLIDIGHACTYPSNLGMVKKPLNKMEDIRGTTILSPYSNVVRLLSGVGGIVLAVPTAEYFDALSKGMGDGVMFNPSSPFDLGWVEGFGPGYVIDCGGILLRNDCSNAQMNLTKYNSLPKDLQETLSYLTWRWASLAFSAYQDLSQAAYLEEGIKKRGWKVIVWSDEEKAKFAKEKAKVMDLWILDMEKKYKRGAEAAELRKIYSEVIAKPRPPAAWMPVYPALALDEATKVKWQAEWNAVYGPGSTWGMGYKAYPNQISINQLEGNEFKAWPK